MNILLVSVLASILLQGATNILPELENQIEQRFTEDTYRRYLYYCRQQNAGLRLRDNSRRWMKSYPTQEILRFGEAEGLLMMEETQEGIGKYRDLYQDSYRWANEIIFILTELEPEEIDWFVEEERRRTGNPTLHARFMVSSYLDTGNDRKALAEIKAALEAGQSPQGFTEALRILSERMGEDKVQARINAASPRTAFVLALELNDIGRIEKAIRDADEVADLTMMGHLCERDAYFEQALEAYEACGRKADAARILSYLGRKDDALDMLAGDNSRQALEQKALILASSKKSYGQAIETYSILLTRYGSRPEWSLKLGALNLLVGKVAKTDKYLRGLPSDTSIILLKGVLAAVQGEVDSVKKELDVSLVSFGGNAYENDLLLLYNIALTQPDGAKPYALALAAFHWADGNQAVEDALKITEKYPTLADEALLLAAESLVKLGRWEEAEETFKRLSTDYAQSPLASRAKYERALLLLNNLDSRAQAEGILKDLILRDPTSVYADLARDEL